MKLLVVEDETALLSEIVNFIKQEGFICETASNFEEAVQKINLHRYDCAVIDITLPGGSGLEIISRLKKISVNTGIIIVSAKNSVGDKISGLNLGADDYLAKPFHLAELNARIKSVIRRRQFDGKDKIIFEEISIFPETREVTVNTIPVSLTRKEYEILLYFISNKQRVLTKESIAEHIWGDQADSFDSLDFVYSQIKNLRKKINDCGGGDYLQSVYGVGYKFTSK